MLFVIAEDAWFWTHRLPLARAALGAGLHVGVVTNDPASAARVRGEGFEFFHHDFRRAGVHPLHDVGTICRLAKLYAAFRPDLVHHVAMKPVVFGSIAARLARVPATVNAVSGLGFALSSERFLARLIRPTVKFGLRFTLGTPRARLIVQNANDAGYFVDAGLVARDRVRLVAGVGVCVRRFAPEPEPDGVPLIVLPARLLRDKGVLEFVAAARHIRQSGVAARFALVGSTDANPTSLTPAEIEAIAREGVVEVWGHRDDMPAVYRTANIVCLPTYREGLPKVLLEAAASGRAVVATDVPGCRDVVRHGETGLLVPPREVAPLAGALLCLIRDRGLRQRFGTAGRRLVTQRFTEERAIDDTFAVYSELLGTPIRRTVKPPAPVSTAPAAPARIPEPSEPALREPLSRRASESS
jgi:glycosyltransferase involved in cell wall biosynthesis